MLAIRLQRTGRSGHAQFRLVAQDRRFHPSSGRVAAYLGSYNPHNKTAELDSQKIAQYLEQGAQPSPRAVKLLKAEGIKLPKWVAEVPQKKKAIRNPEKLRKNRPAEPKAEAPAEAPAEAKADEPADAPDQVEESPATPPAEPNTEPTEAEESKEAAPAEAPKAEDKAEEPAAEAPADDKSAES